MVATLSPATTITTAMQPPVLVRTGWIPEGLDRLAQGMFAVLFGRPAPSGPDVLADEGDKPAVEERP